jgi:hypothetical protein
LAVQLGLFVNFATKIINEGSIHWEKIWKMCEEAYPIKWEYYTIVASRAIANELVAINKYSVFQKPLRWAGLIAYERVAKIVPKDEIILYMLKYISEVDANNANESNAWKIYDTAIHDTKLINEGKIHTAVEGCFRLALISETLGQITLTLSNTHFLSILKQTNLIKYKDSAKEFCKILSKNNFPKTNKKDVLLNDLMRQFYCLIFRAIKYSVDYEDPLNKIYNNHEADDLIRQSNLVAIAFNKAKEADATVSSLPSITNVYKQSTLSGLCNGNNELKLLPN